MRRLALIVLVMLAVVFTTGCGSIQKSSNVQKSALIGGASMGAVGAPVGYLSGAGGVPGALIGVGLGGTAGALAADYYYPEDVPDLPSNDKVEGMNEKLEESDKQVEQLRTELEKQEGQRKALMEAHEEAQKELEGLQKQLGSDDVQVSQTARGDVKMTILSDLLFDSGEATLTSEGEKVLTETAENIRDQYPDAEIEVRGHTDNVPIKHSDWESNWELSSHRALAVVHLLINEEDFQPDRIRAVGLADTQPVADNDTAEGRKKNRRAEIVIRAESTGDDEDN
ncbi:MAG: OmpA family protein [Planctomycetota bacterium]